MSDILPSLFSFLWRERSNTAHHGTMGLSCQLKYFYCMTCPVPGVCFGGLGWGSPSDCKNLALLRKIIVPASRTQFFLSALAVEPGWRNTMESLGCEVCPSLPCEHPSLKQGSWRNRRCHSALQASLLNSQQTIYSVIGIIASNGFPPWPKKFRKAQKLV